MEVNSCSGFFFASTTNITLKQVSYISITEQEIFPASLKIWITLFMKFFHFMVNDQIWITYSHAFEMFIRIVNRIFQSNRVYFLNFRRCHIAGTATITVCKPLLFCCLHTLIADARRVSYASCCTESTETDLVGSACLCITYSLPQTSGRNQRFLLRYFREIYVIGIQVFAFLNRCGHSPYIYMEVKHCNNELFISNA